MAVIYIPRTASTPPVFTGGVTRLALPEIPADAMPVRVMMNGQVLLQQDFNHHAQHIELSGDHSDYDFEVDYYVASSIVVSPEQPDTPDLPDINLYTVRNSTGRKTDGDLDLGTFDLLLDMVDDSEYDLVHANDDLQTDQQLQSAITLSVYSDAYVDGEKGWWGDTIDDSAQANPIANSKLWTLMGKPTTNENRQRGENHIKAALQWLIDEKHVDDIEVSTEHQANTLDWLAFKLNCIRDGKSVLNHTITTLG